MKNMSGAVKKKRHSRGWKERESEPKGGEIREERREGREGWKKRRKVGRKEEEERGEREGREGGKRRNEGKSAKERVSWKGDKRRNKREEWIKRMMRKCRKERASGKEGAKRRRETGGRKGEGDSTKDRFSRYRYPVLQGGSTGNWYRIPVPVLLLTEIRNNLC